MIPHVVIVDGIQAWSETAVGTDSGAEATHAADTDGQHFVTHISGWTDADSLIQIKESTTIKAEWKIDISVSGLSFNIALGAWPVTDATAVVAKVVTSSADCQVNMSGYTISSSYPT
jgi:hypothetical protein